MSIDTNELLERVRALGPFQDRCHAERTVRVTLGILRRLLTEDEARRLESELGDAFRADLAPNPDQPFAGSPERKPAEVDLNEMYLLEAVEEGVRLGLAIEHVQVVMRALGELLPDELLLELRRHLPRLAPLFSRHREPRPPAAPWVIREPEPSAHTLAQGRPGGSRPLSTAPPGSEHPVSSARPERAHAHSVARSDDPHADTKLSSARGLTQERESESLANTRRGA